MINLGTVLGIMVGLLVIGGVIFLLWLGGKTPEELSDMGVAKE